MLRDSEKIEALAAAVHSMILLCGCDEVQLGKDGHVIRRTDSGLELDDESVYFSTIPVGLLDHETGDPII